MSDVLTNWKDRLAARVQLRDRAERQVAYWRVRASEKGITPRERDRRREMLANRRRLLLTRETQVAAARRVIRRHSTPTGVSLKGVAFIASFEGFEPRPYRDAVGVWTIGFGHTKGVGPTSKPLSRTAALALLHRDLNDIYAPPVIALAKALGLKLTQGQFDALVSFVYNLGTGIIGPSTTMGRALRAHNMKAAAAAFSLYDKAGVPPRPLLGLTRRRHAESALFAA